MSTARDYEEGSEIASDEAIVTLEDNSKKIAKIISDGEAELLTTAADA
jgi:hypothetical protein